MYKYEIVREEFFPGTIDDFRALMYEVYQLQPEFNPDLPFLKGEPTPSDYPQNMARWEVTLGGSYKQRGYILARQLPDGVTKLQFAYYSKYKPIGPQFDVEYADAILQPTRYRLTKSKPMAYNLTSKQKDALKSIVHLGRSWREELYFVWHDPDEISDILDYDSTPPQVSRGDIRALAREGLLICDFLSDNKARVILTAKAYSIIDSGLEFHITTQQYDQEPVSDFAKAIILTAIPIEYRAVRAHLTNLKEEVHPMGTVYERGMFSSTAQIWEVGIAEIGPGNPNAAIEAERAIRYFEPDIVLFVGVAGGIKDVALGDVVAATKVYEYESGKDEETFRPRVNIANSTYLMEQRARAEAKKDSWLQRIKGVYPVSDVRALIGPIAAGEKVVASTRSATYEFLRSHYGDALAVEMEGYGILKAAHANPGIEALVIRGISDLIDSKSEADARGSQKIAAHNASAFAFEILANIVIQKKTSGNGQKIAPHLSLSTDIDFSPPTPADEQAGARRSWFIRLRVENNGQAPATNCIGRLLEVINEKGECLKQFDSLDLYWCRQDKSDNYRRLDIRENGDFQYLDIAQVKEAEHVLTLRVVIPDRHRLVKPLGHVGKPEDLPPGTYYMRIAIYADNMSVRSTRFKIEWKDDFSTVPCKIEVEEFHS